ncbi:MAG: nucleotide exchange factor GrpE [Acidobacteria bacterium]|nr:nucleotide exchange factor GrpE [Acidobacteriota bacterium]
MQDKLKFDDADDISIEIIDDEETTEEQAKARDMARQAAEVKDYHQTLEVVCEALKSEAEELKTENATLRDQLLRKQAEFENYRRRTEKERSEIFKRGQKEVLIEMLSVLDNFERAMLSVAQNPADEDALKQGFELIYKQFKDILTKLGVEPLDVIGKTFDPHLHEAVTIEQTSEQEANTVIAEFQKGYKLGEQLLRPAQVKVAASNE